MADLQRNIGLSLGADICWPICFEHVMRRLNLSIPIGEDTLRFHVERVSIEPYNLRQDCKYDVVIDRLTHWYHTSREWIKKAILMDGLHVFNNPWAVQSMEKHTTYAAMMKLGMPIPNTWMIPPKEYGDDNPDLKPTLEQYAKLFEVTQLGETLGFPMFIKPYDGGGWRAVTKCDDENALREAYEKSGRAVMHVQAAVTPYEEFVRCIGFGPQVLPVKYDPSAPLHDRYTMETDFLSPEHVEHLRRVTLTINAFFGWEFNSCESLLKDNIWHPIDFANPCPDSQVTSLHYHFPWLIKAYVRWAVFCAATKKPMAPLDWTPFMKVANTDASYEEKLAEYAKIADARMETARFEEFCEKHLSHLDEVAAEFFGTDEARDAVRQKVTALYPEHEIDQFTDLFWQRIQTWREQQ